MNILQTVIAAIAVVVLLYVAFIVGAVVMRILLGLLAIAAAVWMVRMLVASVREQRGT
jgi:hypothetical protein